MVNDVSRTALGVAGGHHELMASLLRAMEDSCGEEQHDQGENVKPGTHHVRTMLRITVYVKGHRDPGLRWMSGRLPINGILPGPIADVCRRTAALPQFRMRFAVNCQLAGIPFRYLEATTSSIHR